MMPKPADKWMDFAHADLRRATILFRENDFEGTCFHAQQAAEKALKGFLVDHDVSYPRSHDLVNVNYLCRNIDADFSILDSKVALLNQFYMPTRYPDAPAGITSVGSPSKDLTLEALDDAREIVEFCKERVR